MEHLRLPPTVIGTIDIARLMREMNNLDDFFTSSRVRTGGTSMLMPKLSRQLDQLAHDNEVNLLDESHRQKVSAALKAIYDNAPRLNISFASEPSTKAFEQVLVWLRENIHPHTMVQIGLQPAIAAGAVLRTPNRIFDMSLRAELDKQRPYLARLIKGAVDGHR